MSEERQLPQDPIAREIERDVVDQAVATSCNYARVLRSCTDAFIAPIFRRGSQTDECEDNFDVHVIRLDADGRIAAVLQAAALPEPNLLDLQRTCADKFVEDVGSRCVDTSP